ncbi:MAG: DUF2934 domain-containing protein [Nitrospira sp.]|nr:DUF2934 domain-containing protein [Nitrospira sp.]MDH4303527.1 DUF2934 domain-containing protein [Nitrospira sp.]MDH5192614.1 DUF2934 domain-containing protein [Nitrospira sp.]
MKQENRKGPKKEINGVEPGGDVLSVQKQIALRAYELYLQRGDIDGHAEEDWLQAERDILENEQL